MRWYLNETSLQGQFNEPCDFISTLAELLSFRSRFNYLSTNFHISRNLNNAIVSHGTTVHSLLINNQYRNIRTPILKWISQGPFLEDQQTYEAEDYFECEDKDVTNAGLGECARRKKIDQKVAAFSFPGGSSNFASTPLTVHHGIPEERLGAYEIENFWVFEELSSSVLSAIPPPTNWRELIERARIMFPNLLLPDSIYNSRKLVKEPFDSVICNSSLELLSYLDKFVASRATNGTNTQNSEAIINNYFHGDNAKFSSESNSNKQRFRCELTFQDPTNPCRSIFAHWHGKISHRTFRIHFEWPVPTTASRLTVLYLGPKITKN